MYRLSEAAATDIEHIFDWSLAEFGFAQAEAYYKSISACMDALVANPAVGVSIENIRTGYRRFSHQSHVIFLYADARRNFNCPRFAQTHGCNEAIAVIVKKVWIII